MLRNILCFLLMALINPFLFWVSFSIPLLSGVWFFWAYHGIEGVVILALLIGRMSRPVKLSALCALLGAVVGFVGELWISSLYLDAMVKSAFDGLEP